MKIKYYQDVRFAILYLKKIDKQDVKNKIPNKIYNNMNDFFFANIVIKHIGWELIMIK